jgi:hypothetical protein
VSHLARRTHFGKVLCMRSILLAVLLAAGVTAGCSKSDNTHAAEAAKLPTATVDEVDQAIAKGDCVPVDANGEATRKKMGVVPGAVLLTDSEDYKLSELPADKSSIVRTRSAVHRTTQRSAR